MRKEKRRKRANNWYKNGDDLANGSDRHSCRSRYQQTPVEVYARFIAVDQVILLHSDYLSPEELINFLFCYSIRDE